MAQEETEQAGTPGRQPVGARSGLVVDGHGAVAGHGDGLFCLDLDTRRITHVGGTQTGDPSRRCVGQLLPIIGDLVSPKQRDVDYVVAVAND